MSLIPDGPPPEDDTAPGRVRVYGDATAGHRGAIDDPRRLAAVSATGLLDSAAEQPFDRLARLASLVLDTPYAFVTIVDDQRSYWKSCIGVDAHEPGERQNRVEESFCQYVVTSGSELIVGDTVLDPRTSDNPSNVSMGVRAWAGYPVRSPAGEVLGTFCVVDTRPRSWTTQDAEVLETLAQAATAEIALRAGATELRAFARTLQESLLPPKLPEVDGVELAAIYRPARDGAGVVGDFFDVFRDGDRWFVLIGDVCGHGVEAAKLAAVARWSVRATASGQEPAPILRHLQCVLEHVIGDDVMFMTAQLAALDVRADGTVEVSLAGAGHPPALVRRADGSVDHHGTGGSVLGLQGTCAIAESSFSLGGGDLLVVYTDGLPEARSGSDLLGDDEVVHLLAAHGGEGPAALAQRLEAAAVAASGGSLVDDVAVIVAAPAGARRPGERASR